MSYIILDIDNCISDDAWRVNKIRWDAKDPFQRYHDYHMLSSFDKAHNTHLGNEHKVIISTSRSEFYEQITKHWLLTKGITPVALLMRKNNDHSATPMIKTKHYRHILNVMGILPNEIYCAYDDNPQIIAMYANLGVRVKHIFINDPNQYERHKYAQDSS